ncbi:hypothetical protein L218DRAFT_987231 [Marasmius fiardii PR-910]|nr:hypothetical protein L218DRAFT_987231 [Marasmius fiardii PR-910]
MSTSSESSPDPSATMVKDEAFSDHPDDPQLKIRIPNPKIYMARQSMWVGHRGKLRCDSCRAQNLKCDRVQPVCNHCAWTPDKECKYTPVPTPSHRGVPRCLSCQQNNLKCDRDLPACNQCKLRGNNPQCVYASKRRKQTAVVDGSVRANPDGLKDEERESSISLSAPSSILTLDPREAGLSRDMVGTPSSSHPPRVYGAPPTTPNVMPPAPITTPAPVVGTQPVTKVKPWFHLSYVALPPTIRNKVATLDASVMPDRALFELGLNEFLSRLLPKMAETACPSTATYAAINRSLLSGEAHGLSPNVLMWVNCHRLLPGSTQKYLLLKPKDSDTPPSPVEEAQRLQEYQLRIDSDKTDIPRGQEDHVFDRLIVREQYYDVLAYAHRDHATAWAMVDEIQLQLGVSGVTWPMAEIFVGLCPRCSSRKRTRTNDIVMQGTSA